jgi:hypothetical protein
VRFFEVLCLRFVSFSLAIHRIGPSPILMSQGFSPGNTSSVSLRLPPSPRGKVFVKAMYEGSSSCVRNSLLFCSLIHRAGPLQILYEPGLSPGGTSSTSQARHLPLGGRLRDMRDHKKCVKNRERRKSFPCSAVFRCGKSIPSQVFSAKKRRRASFTGAGFSSFMQVPMPCRFSRQWVWQQARQG